jgi:membrane fusion protein (multidrug efflux system)
MERGNKKKVVQKRKTAVAKRTLVTKKVLAARRSEARRHQAAVKKEGKRKTILSTLLGVVLLGGAGFGINEATYYGKHVDTDDAHVDANISPVIARIGGYVDSVRFVDNQRVLQGDTLVILDGRDYRVKLEQAEASLALNNSSVNINEANIMTSEANIGAAAADVEAAKTMLREATNGVEKNAAEAQLSRMKARLRVIQKQADVHREQLKSTFSSIDMKKADIDYAKLQLSYTVITAPVSGIVSKRMIQPGEYVQSGQSLFSIVNDTSMYVTANFKETQIERLRHGQHVDLRVDAYPDAEFEGEVESFSPATGSMYSLLPAENATGNFVKVVQRVPVKITIAGSTAHKRLLKPGMNVKAIVSLDR